MVDVSGDPTIEAAHIWSNTLTLLKRNSTLTAREKGWLEGIVPEGVFGSTIVLCVDNNDTLQAIQGNLNESLLQALHTATGENMFPAFKVVPRSPLIQRMLRRLSLISARNRMARRNL